MNQPTNPYLPPAISAVEKADANAHVQTVSLFALITWPFVFCLNLIVPMGFGWSMTFGYGRTGMLVAVVLFLLCGWAVCISKPYYARRLLLGSLLFAVTQVFPILQVIAGTIAVAIAMQLKLIENEFSISNGPAGFFITCLVGIFCIFLAFMLGLALGAIFPKDKITKESRF